MSYPRFNLIVIVFLGLVLWLAGETKAETIYGIFTGHISSIYIDTAYFGPVSIKAGDPVVGHFAISSEPYSYSFGGPFYNKDWQVVWSADEEQYAWDFYEQQGSVDANTYSANADDELGGVEGSFAVYSTAMGITVNAPNGYGTGAIGTGYISFNADNPVLGPVASGFFTLDNISFGPEPSSIFLLASGAVGLLLNKRRTCGE